jgi:hypothetical protein
MRWRIATIHKEVVVGSRGEVWEVWEDVNESRF